MSKDIERLSQIQIDLYMIRRERKKLAHKYNLIKAEDDKWITKGDKLREERMKIVRGLRDTKDNDTIQQQD